MTPKVVCKSHIITMASGRVKRRPSGARIHGTSSASATSTAYVSGFVDQYGRCSRAKTATPVIMRSRCRT